MPEKELWSYLSGTLADIITKISIKNPLAKIVEMNRKNGYVVILEYRFMLYDRK